MAGLLRNEIGGLAAIIIALTVSRPVLAQPVLAQGVLAQSAPPASAPPLAAGLRALPQGSPLPRINPSAPPAVGGPSRLAAPPPASVPLGEGSVVVRAVTVDGETAYPAARLLQLTAGLVGPAVPAEKIQAARDAMQALYRRDGYVLTAVRVSLDAQGRLRFIVTEGHIAEVKLDGDVGPAGVQVLRFLNHLTEVRPIDQATLERWLLLAGDVPGVRVNAVLRPSTTEPGALTLVARVSRQAWSALSTADNRAYTLTGPEEFLAVMDANSFTEYGERTEVSLYGAARATQLFGQVSSEMFVGSSGLKVRLYGGSGTSDPTGSLGAIGYHGVTTAVGAAMLYPLVRSRQQTLNVGGYFDALQSDIHTGDTLASQDNLRIIRLGADYALQDSVLGAARGATNSASLRVSHGLTGLGASSNGFALPGRVGERVDFQKVSLELTRTQTLFEPWRNATVALFGLFAGQYSQDVIPPAEKFFLGGSRYTRGYYAGELTGDSAMVATVELQLNTGFTLDLLARSFDIGTQFYGFYDWGEVWQNQRSDPNGRLASAGGGVRLQVTQFTEFDLEGVARFTRNPQGVSSNTPALTPAAVYWRVLARF